MVLFPRFRALAGLLCLLTLLSTPALAESDACGYVSAPAKPPQSEELYPADIRRIDGEDLPRRVQNRYRLPVGKHAIAIQERVADTPRGYTKLRKLGNKAVPLVYKIIEIEVQANTNHQISARLYPDRISARAPNDFWDPVIWRSVEETCS